MIKINLDIKKLAELHTSLSTTHDKITAINNQIFTKLKKIDTMWDDPNTSVFISQNNLDKTKIDEYCEETKRINNTILEFTNNLNSIAKRCNCPGNGNFNYNDDNVKSLINYCNSAHSLTISAKSKLDSMDIPSSFRYANNLNTMKFKLMDINSLLKNDIDDLNEVVSLTNMAYNKIKSSPKTEEIILKPLRYTSNIQNVNFVSSKSKIDQALNSQKLGTSNKKVDYNENSSNFTNNSSNKISRDKKTDFDEKDSAFVNAANQTSASGTTLTLDENENSFVNNETMKTVSQTNINDEFKNSNINFINPAKNMQATSNETNFTNQNINIKIPNSQD